MAYILLWSSAVMVHDSQAYRKMYMTRERISHIFEVREILLSIQTGFSLVNAAVVSAILGSISGLEPSSKDHVNISADKTYVFISRLFVNRSDCCPSLIIVLS